MTRTTRSVEPSVTLGNTRYDPQMYLVFVDAKAIRLTRSETKLLSLMLPRYNQPVRKLLLFDEMYGHLPQPPHPSALNVLMCRLRRKLQASDLSFRAREGKITLAFQTD